MAKVCDIFIESQRNNNFFIENILQKPNNFSLKSDSNLFEINENNRKVKIERQQQNNTFSDSLNFTFRNDTTESSNSYQICSGKFI